MARSRYLDPYLSWEGYLMPAPDMYVAIVDENGAPDMRVTVIDGITDLNPTNGDVLQWNGTRWVNVPADTPGAHAATHAAGGGDDVTLTQAQITGLTASLAALVPKSLFDANTILIATSDDTPVALTVGASTIVGRKATGGIVALTGAEALVITGAAPAASPTFTGAVTLADGVNVVLNATTGSKIGATGDKIGFLGATPIVRPASTTDLRTALINLGLYASGGASPLNLNGGALTAESLKIGTGGSTHGYIRSDDGVYIVGDNDNNGSDGTIHFQHDGNVDIFTIGANTGTVGDLGLFDGAKMVLGTTTGTRIGTAVGQKLAFHNSVPVVQRAGAAQAAVATTAATNVTPYGFSQAQADAIVALVNELRAALVEKGLIKGAA